MKRTKPEATEIEQLTVRFPKGLLDLLRLSAEENDRSLNAEIVNAVRCRARTVQKQMEETHDLVGSRND